MKKSAHIFGFVFLFLIILLSAKAAFDPGTFRIPLLFPQPVHITECTFKDLFENRFELAEGMKLHLTEGEVIVAVKNGAFVTFPGNTDLDFNFNILVQGNFEAIHRGDIIEVEGTLEECPEEGLFILATKVIVTYSQRIKLSDSHAPAWEFFIATSEK